MLETVIREAWRANGINRGLPRAPRICAILQRAKRASSASGAMEILSSQEPNAEAARSILGAVTVAEDLSEWLEVTPREKIDLAFERAAEKARIHFRSRGRTPGTGRNPAFDMFVYQLYFFVKAAGGDPGHAGKKGADPVGGKFFAPGGHQRGAVARLANMGQLPPGLVPSTENSKLSAFKRAETGYRRAYPDIEA